MTKSILSRSAVLLAIPSFGALAEDTSVNCDTGKEDIASGEYNERIDAHIALIKSTCGIE